MPSPRTSSTVWLRWCKRAVVRLEQFALVSIHTSKVHAWVPRLKGPAKNSVDWPWRDAGLEEVGDPCCSAAARTATARMAACPSAYNLGCCRMQLHSGKHVREAAHIFEVRCHAKCSLLTFIGEGAFVCAVGKFTRSVGDQHRNNCCQSMGIKRPCTDVVHTHGT